MNKKTIVEIHYHWDIGWSWEFVSEPLFNILKQYYNVYSITQQERLPDKIKINNAIIVPDLYFLQSHGFFKYLQPSQFTKTFFKKIILRLGGIRGLDKNPKLPSYIKHCKDIIATNHFLYNYAKQFNQNVSLIPNGLDLSQVSIPYR